MEVVGLLLHWQAFAFLAWEGVDVQQMGEPDDFLQGE